jgi:cytochrome b
MSPKAVYVWDPLVRIFHWSLVLFFVIAYVTEDDFMRLHEVAGYIVLGLVGFRVIWGLIGPKYARFSNFVYRPTTIVDYLKSLSSQPKHYLGHNPAGGLMVVVLLITIALTSWSGIKAQEAESMEQASINTGISIKIISAAHADEDEHEGKEGDEFWEEIHEVIANFTVFLIFLHIAGVFASSVIHRENLLRGMITGYKEREE